MQSYDRKHPSVEEVAKTLRSMADAVETGRMVVDRIALYGEENGFAPAPFDFTMTGRIPQQGLLS